MHELGFRTPIVFYWSGRVPAGQTRNELVSTLDLLPTLLDYAGLATLPGDAPGNTTLVSCLPLGFVYGS